MTRKKARKVWRVTITGFNREVEGEDTTAELERLIGKAMDAIEAIPCFHSTWTGDDLILDSGSKEELEQGCKKVRKILQALSKKTGIDFSSQTLEPVPWSCMTKLCPTCFGFGRLDRGHQVKS